MGEEQLRSLTYDSRELHKGRVSALTGVIDTLEKLQERNRKENNK